MAAISTYSCKIWDAASGDELLDLSRTLVHGIAVAWSPSGARLAVGTAAVEWEGHNNFIVTVFEAGSGDRICRIVVTRPSSRPLNGMLLVSGF